MNILVICDDFWHPARTPRAGLKDMETPAFHFDWIENAHEWTAESMSSYPVVILTKSNNVSSGDQTNWMVPQVEDAFVRYVEDGGGLLVIHSGLAGYQETTRLRALIGGVFDHHPAQCPVSIEPKADHPLASGTACYTVQDEHYFVLLDDPQVEQFLLTRSEHGVQPGGWTRRQSKGRVCVLTPGHNPEVWIHPSFQALIQNAIAWCSHSQE